MNKNRRKELKDWIKKIKEWAGEGEVLRRNIENICSDEEDYFNNMPENLQGSARGVSSEDFIDRMNDAIGSVENAIEAASEAVDCLDGVV